jgi:hypothetical protein
MKTRIDRRQQRRKPGELSPIIRDAAGQLIDKYADVWIRAAEDGGYAKKDILKMSEPVFWFSFLEDVNDPTWTFHQIVSDYTDENEPLFLLVRERIAQIVDESLHEKLWPKDESICDAWDEAIRENEEREHSLLMAVAGWHHVPALV